MIEAGELRYQVRIERPVEAAEPDTFGKPILTWETVATRRAKIVAAASGEGVGQEVQRAIKSWTITVRRLAGLDETMRAVFTWLGVERTAYLGSLLEEGAMGDTVFSVAERE
jgi:hypothetical protein